MGEVVTTEKLNRILGNAKTWFGISITLGSIIVSGLLAVNDMRTQIALLNQKLDIITNDHEKRIQTVESLLKVHDQEITKLNTLQIKK